MNIKFNNQSLVPVIIQDFYSLEVLMLGYMNNEAFNKTIKEKIVTFFSRSKNRLWTKGEKSGNYLIVKDYFIDCDADTILIKVLPNGPTCHKGNNSCFNTKKNQKFIYNLQEIIKNKLSSKDENSYTYKLSKQGINKIAQKVGEEAVELVIEAINNNNELFLNESADLLYHYLILLQIKGFTLKHVEKILKIRNLKK